jgi:hypothetical protein
MPHDPVRVADTRAWLIKARQDLRSADHGLSALPPLLEDVLFHCLMAGKLGIEILTVDHWAVVNLAEETGFTTYDASYLWLAGQLKAELITLDAKMQKAAKSI